MAIEKIGGVPSRNPRCHKQLGLVKTLGFPATFHSHLRILQNLPRGTHMYPLFPHFRSELAYKWESCGFFRSPVIKKVVCEILRDVPDGTDSGWFRVILGHGVGSIWKMIHDDFQWFQDVPSWFWWFWYCNCDVFCVGIGSICSQKAFWVWSSPVMAFARWKTGILG